MLGGVQRQYSGTLGKTANCQLGVSVNAVTEHASCPLDWRLFVPERWDEAAMATRRAACHVPEGVHHRPKWQLVLDMLDELGGWDLWPPVLLADSGYGEVGEFRWGLDARGVPYVVEVRSDTSASPEQVRPSVAPHKGSGRRPGRATPGAVLAGPARPGRGAAGLRGACLAAWQQGPQRGRFLRLRVRPAGVTPRRLARQHGGELPVRSPAGPVAPGQGHPDQVLAGRLARSRWRVEQDYRELKGAAWLDHFEGRGWVGWHHHVTLVLVAHGFLTLERLRHPKPAASA